MKLIGKQNKYNNGFSFSRISGKTKDVAKASSSFLLYPKLISFLLLLTLSLLITRIYFSNQLAISGGLVSVNASRAEDISKENYQLENKISQVSSLNYVDSQSERLGLVKITKVEVLNVPSGVALNR